MPGRPTSLGGDLADFDDLVHLDDGALGGLGEGGHEVAAAAAHLDVAERDRARYARRNA